MLGKVTCVSEEVVQTSSGTRLLTTYKSPLYDIDGSVMGTVGVGIDITQEKEYKQQLISKSQTLESIFTTMDCGVLCHSVDGTLVPDKVRHAVDCGFKVLIGLPVILFCLIRLLPTQERLSCIIVIYASYCSAVRTRCLNK